MPPVASRAREVCEICTRSHANAHGWLISRPSVMAASGTLEIKICACFDNKNPIHQRYVNRYEHYEAHSKVYGSASVNFAWYTGIFGCRQINCRKLPSLSSRQAIATCSRNRWVVCMYTNSETWYEGIHNDIPMQYWVQTTPLMDWHW